MTTTGSSQTAPPNTPSLLYNLTSRALKLHALHTGTCSLLGQRALAEATGLILGLPARGLSLHRTPEASVATPENSLTVRGRWNRRHTVVTVGGHDAARPAPDFRFVFRRDSAQDGAGLAVWVSWGQLPFRVAGPCAERGPCARRVPIG